MHIHNMYAYTNTHVYASTHEGRIYSMIDIVGRVICAYVCIKVIY